MLSPPDWPKLSWLNKHGHVFSCDPEVDGPSRQGVLEGGPFTGRGVIRKAHVSPSGRFIAAYTKNSFKLITSFEESTECVYVNHLPNLERCWRNWSLASGTSKLASTSAVGDVFDTGLVHSSEPDVYNVLQFRNAATGSEIALAMAPRDAVTLPRSSRFAGHCATIVQTAQGSLQLSGYAPDDPGGRATWTRELSPDSWLRESADREHFEIVNISGGSRVSLYDVAGDQISTFVFKLGQNGPFRPWPSNCFPSLSYDGESFDCRIGAVGADRYLYFDKDAFCVYGNVPDSNADGLSPLLARSSRPITRDFGFSCYLSVLPTHNHRDVTIVLSPRGYVAAVGNATAEVLHLWSLPGCVTAWAWPPEQCAAHELARAMAAVAATDELPRDPETMSLVRTVLVAFVVEDARLTVVRL